MAVAGDNSPWARLAQLPLVIESYELERHAATLAYGFERVRVSFSIKGDAPPEKLREIVERAKARSVVYDIVSNPVPVDVHAEVG